MNCQELRTVGLDHLMQIGRADVAIDLVVLR
jgi:hypothetical protein